MTTVRKFDLFGLIVAIIIFGFFCFFFPTNQIYSIINALLGITSLSLLFLSGRNPYELRQIFYLANLVFLVLAARMEKSLDVLYWGSPLSVLDSYEVVGIWSFIAIILFSISHKLGSKIKLSETRVENHWDRFRKVNGTALIILSVLATFVIYQHNGWNILSVFFRGGAEDSRLILSQSSWLLYQLFLYPLPAVCLVMYLLHGRRSALVFWILFVLVILANPPTGMARWQAAMLYGAIGITGLPALFGRRLFLCFAQFLGLFVLFPLLDTFRRFTEDVKFKLNSDWILIGHLDSAQNIARVVEIDLVTYGNQLLGAIFFFVPRNFWPNKPVGSGHYVSGLTDLTFSNISMHFFGEGYINFGFFGILVFACSLGAIFGALDRRAWCGICENRFLVSIYPFLLGWVFFLVRGDFTSSFSYMVGTLCSVLFVFKFSLFISQLKIMSKRFI